MGRAGGQQWVESNCKERGARTGRIWGAAYWVVEAACGVVVVVMAVMGAHLYAPVPSGGRHADRHDAVLGRVRLSGRPDCIRLIRCPVAIYPARFAGGALASYDAEALQTFKTDR